jgi:ABC-type multidrug transport system ATPase subunit
MRNLLIFGYMRGLSGVAFKARCLALMTEFGLEGEERKKVGEYSDGMRQRLALLRCVLHEPKVLILDEPTEGMDPVGVRFVRAFLYQQSRVQGRTVILSSHLLGEIEETCDSILLLRKGQVQLHEATSRLLSRLDLDYTLSVSDPKSALAALREKAYAEARIVGTQIRLSCRREMVARLVAALTSQGIEVYDVARTTSGLEALFQGDATCSATCLGS